MHTYIWLELGIHVVENYHMYKKKSVFYCVMFVWYEMHKDLSKETINPSREFGW
jgi:hypothetical protein